MLSSKLYEVCIFYMRSLRPTKNKQGHNQMVETEDHEGNQIAEVQEVENAFSTESSDELLKKKKK